MSSKWKYVVPVNKDLIVDIEKHFNITLPEDYKSLLEKFNRGKPEKDQFDIASRKSCVLDYLMDLKDVISTSQRIGDPRFIPIGSDPFGNIIGYCFNKDNQIENLFFWDHETGCATKIAKTFREFLEMLY